MMLRPLLLTLALQADAAPPAGAAGQAPPAARMDFRSAVGAGAAALARTDYDAAIAAYEAALADRPDSAEAAYNLGVALYHAGRFKDAEKRFAQAGASASNGPRSDAGLAASSLFNRAASFYGATRPQAEAAQRMVEGGTQADAGDAEAAPIDPAALDQAIKDAKESFKGFKDAAYAAPEDGGARANAEQSMRLVRALEELRKQQQQDKKQQQDQQQQQDPSNQRQSDPSKGDPQQDQQEQDRSKQDQQAPPKDESKPDAGDRKEQPKEEQGKPEQEPPKDRQQPPEQDRPPQDKDQGASGQSQPKEGSRDGQPPPKDGEMTKEQADRLLQAVRDRERERRTAQERKAEAARGRPPAKDW